MFRSDFHFSLTEKIVSKLLFEKCDRLLTSCVVCVCTYGNMYLLMQG